MDHPVIDIPALSRLARIDVSDEESKQLKEQLPRIIDYVGQLQSVPAEPLAIVPEILPLRNDASRPSPDRDSILNQAPSRQEDFWSVKAVL